MSEAKLWESVIWAVENSSYCHVDVISGRRVDQKTKKFLDNLIEYASENREIVAGSLEAAMQEGAEVAYHDNKVDDPTLEKASKATLLDMTTASMMKQIFEALNEKNRQNIRNRPFLEAVNICWKLVGRI